METKEKTERSYSPLGGNVDEKGYATNLGHLHSDPIPEPRLAPPSFADRKDFFETEADLAEPVNGAAPTPKAAASPRPPKAPPREPLDPGYTDMSSAEKRRGAEALTASVLQGYTLLCKQGGKLVMVKTATVNKLVREGKLDTSTMYQTPSGDHATAIDIINAFNSEIDGIFEVSEEFTEEVSPIMTRVFMKRGVAMSDEMQLAWLFGKDISVKAIMAMSLSKQSKQFIKSFTVQNAASGQRTPPPPPIEDEPIDAEVQAPPPPPPAAKPKAAKVKHMELPKQNTATVSPSMAENAPGDFFKNVDIDAPYDDPQFGDKAKLDGINEIAKKHQGEKPKKRKPTAKKKGKK